MSTLKNNITANRIALLSRTNETIFHLDDLANLWQIQDKNTLRVTLVRYVKTGLLFQIYRGFYSLSPLEKIDPLLLGSRAIHDFCYLSTESVLFESGYISQPPSYYTFIGKKSLKFTIGPYHYSCRQLDEKYLYNPEGVFIENGIQKATPKRAIADMLYFNPRHHFDKKIKYANPGRLIYHS